MAHSIGMTGMDPHTGAALAEALLQATRRLGDAWRVVDDHDADFVFVDMDSMYGPMSWIRLHAAGKKVIGVTGSSRTQTDFHLAKPFDQDSVEALLRSIVQGPDAAPASLTASATPAPAPADQLPEEAVVARDEEQGRRRVRVAIEAIAEAPVRVALERATSAASFEEAWDEDATEARERGSS